MKYRFPLLQVLLILLISGCSQQVHYPKKNIFALKHDSISSELIVFTVPNYEMESVVLFGVTSYTLNPIEKMIIFSTLSYGNEQLAIIPKEGNARLLTDVNQYLRFPNISPDGKLILFEMRNDITGDSKVMIMDKDKLIMEPLVNGDSSGIFPIWLRDGEHVSFLTPSVTCTSVELAHCYDLTIVSIETKSIVAKINGPINYYFPVSWSSGADEVVFSRWINGRYKLIIYNFSEENETAFGDNNQNNTIGVWSDNGERIAYSRTSSDGQDTSSICFIENSTPNCNSLQFQSITGILWIDNQTLLFGTFNSENNSTTVKLMDTISERTVDLGTYSGYIDSFQTLK